MTDRSKSFGGAIGGVLIVVLVFLGVYFLAAAILHAQSDSGPIPGITDTYNRYHAIYTASLSATTDSVTVQQNASPSVIQVFENATIQCSVTCAFTWSWNGTAASATQFNLTRVGNSPAPQATAWHTSNVGGGTTGSTFTITGGGQEVFDLSKFQTNKRGSDQNLTVSFASLTGVISIDLQFVEK